mmetsp:Transcript_5056/g.10661  ORF Transcript_5056/g.10661 Transcript_5056/m.10661 type:complete len:393 (+) Transcript_5056:131-1309(+)
MFPQIIHNSSRGLSVGKLVVLIGATAAAALSNMSENTQPADYYRSDGVRITHDPFSPEMEAKYGKPGATDRDGFDPYADSVGAGIYSGTVRRDPSDGSVLIGKQYQNHNSAPGPIYSGGGYTPVSVAISSYRAESERGRGTSLGGLLDQYPDLANDVSTGGALPLHTCGMSRDNQHAAASIIARGGDVEAIDTYGYTALHRMASNNLAVGARALLDAGANHASTGDGSVPTPLRVARESRALDVVAVLEAHDPSMERPSVISVRIQSAGYTPIVGLYTRRGADSLPKSFVAVCNQNGWDGETTWKRLNGGGNWFGHETNDSYIYYNRTDGHWWIDGPDGLGIWIAPSRTSVSPPASVIEWTKVGNKDRNLGPAPKLLIHRGKNLGTKALNEC